MKLFTKDIDKRLFQQYQNGSDLDSQVAVAKIFNPYGRGRWFLLNSDPQDKDYLWAIVQMGDVVEVGSVLRSELESVRVSPFKLPLERDLGFRMVNAGELYRGLQEGKFYKKGGWVDSYAGGGMTPGRWYKDNTGKELRYIGESEGKLLFNDGEKIVKKVEDDFHSDVKENKAFKWFADGGFVDKTDEELKGMSDDELFEYLDAKAAYMKQYAKPLSSFKAKNYAANSAAVQFQNEGTSKLDANFPSLSKINEQATKDYQETIAKRSDKMAEGGSTQNGWYEKFNAGFEDLLKKGYINDAEYKYLEKWLENYDPIDDYGNMGGRAAAKKYVDDNRRYVEMAKGGMTEHGLKVGDKIVSDQFWDKNIVVENTKTKKKAIVDLESGKRKESMAMGGKVKFQDKVKAIKASLLKTKKVPKKVQKDYGKTYNAKEAELAAKRIAGAMAKKGIK
jgi:hypothetical protein